MTGLSPAWLHRLTSDEFKESDHPRKEDGEFAPAGGGGAKSGGKTSAGLTGTTTVIAGRHVQPNGSPLPKHIPRIPPAWTNVHYAADPKSEVLVSGYDKKGRKQVVYSDAHWAKAAKAKFGRINKLQKKFEGIKAQNAKQRQSKDPVQRDLADTLHLVMSMGLRPGSDAGTGAVKKAYGATTLLGSHVVSEGGNVYLRFTGKKGVALNLKVPDKQLGHDLLKRSLQAGPDGKLFPTVTNISLRKYVKGLDGGGFKTKDFRTLIGTSLAYDLVNKMEKPSSKSGYKKAVKEVGKAVSETLGNTPTIALQSYINPVVFADWRLE